MLTPPDPSLPPVERLRQIMAQLRSPEGCPWDHEQTLETLKPFLLEEAYEVIEAIDSGDTEHHCEELGDLLLQVVFQSQLCEEKGHFSLDDVARGITEKLERRHPHVFGDGDASTPDEVLKAWNEIKAGEKTARPQSALEGIPKGLPALLRAQDTQRKAAKCGFDWPDTSGPLQKLDEEISEFKEAVARGDEDAIHDEVGDVLFTMVNLCRHLDLHAELCLQQAVEKFVTRFKAVEQSAAEQDLDLLDCGIDALDVLWEDAKKQLEGAGDA